MIGDRPFVTKPCISPQDQRPDAGPKYGWKVIWEAGPELVNLSIVHPKDPGR